MLNRTPMEYRLAIIQIHGFIDHLISVLRKHQSSLDVDPSVSKLICNSL